MSYLEGYGVREARQERKLLYSIGIVLLLVVAGIVVYFWRRDRPELLKVEGFLSALRNKDYKAAYEFWGCNEQKPCREYPFDKFMEDWGPSSPQGNAAGAVKSDG